MALSIHDSMNQFTNSDNRFLYEPCEVVLGETDGQAGKVYVDIERCSVSGIIQEVLPHYIILELSPYNGSHRFGSIDLSRVVRQITETTIKAIGKVTDLADKEVVAPDEKFVFKFESASSSAVLSYTYRPIYGTRPFDLIAYSDSLTFGSSTYNPYNIYNATKYDLLGKWEINTSILANGTITMTSTKNPVRGNCKSILYFRSFLGYIVAIPIDDIKEKYSHKYSGDLGAEQFTSNKSLAEIVGSGPGDKGVKFDKLNSSVTRKIDIKILKVGVNRAKVIRTIMGSPYIGIHRNFSDNTDDDNIEIVRLNSCSIPINSRTEELDISMSFTAISNQEMNF